MRRVLACLLCALAFSAAAGAHALDEYVQAAQISLAPGGARVGLRLTPGAEVADHVFKMIDVDGDGRISSAEGRVYARLVLKEVALEVDGRRVPLSLTAAEFPSRQEMHAGVGAIRLDLSAEAALNASGEHRLTFRNDHLPELGAYLVNALVPATDEIRIRGQERDPLQRELRLSFQVAHTDARGPRFWAGGLMLCLCLGLSLTRRKRLGQYLRRRDGGRIPDSPAR